MADATYTVERSTTIEATPSRIYEQIVNFHNWPAWSPWEALDPELKRTYSGPEIGPGAGYAWTGNRKAGRGRMEIIDVTEPSAAQIDIFFEKPFKAHNHARFAIEPAGSGSHVTWTLTGTKNFMTKVMGLFISMDKLVGPDFEKGLAQLKTVAENPAPSEPASE